MASSGHPTYRPNLNRNPTKKWAEAQADYGEDDWDDDEYGNYRPPEPAPVSAGPQRHPGWGQRGEQAPLRNFTNPSLATNHGRTSFDRGDERRYFSAGGYDQGHQGYSQRPHSFEQEEQGYSGFGSNAPPPPTLQVNTRFHPTSSAVQSGPQHYAQADAHGVPFSAPVGHQPQPFPLDSRATHPPGVQQGSTDIEPNVPGTGFAPRKSSLSQQQHPGGSNITPQHASTKAIDPHTDPIDTKPLPFIRPADIYKRVEEEREKERRSQDSSRPSIDSASGRVTSSPTRSEDVATSHTRNPTAEETSSSRKMRTALDTVVERKSEYGLSPQSAGSTYSADVSASTRAMNASATTPVDTSARPQVSRTASSVYTEVPDPTSATSAGSHPFNPAVISGRSPTAESHQQSVPQYSPSNSRPSDIRAEAEASHEVDEFPDFDRGTSLNASTSITGSKSTPPEGLLGQTGSSTATSRSQDLQHQPSVGYKSAVRQAFNTEHNSTLSPTGTDETLLRSDTTSDISPIIQRQPGVDLGESANPNVLLGALPGHTGPSHDRSESIATIKAKGHDQDNTILPATTFVPGYRRDNNPPLSEGSKAHRPLSVEIPSVPEAQQGTLSTVTASAVSAPDPSAEKLPATHYNPPTSTSGPQRQMKSQTDLSLPPMSRTESEDWQEWQAQRRLIHAKHGIENSSTASLTMSSPVSRSESPVKGVVRDIADKLDTNSGRSSPAVHPRLQDQPTAMSKPPNVRNDSFRPAIPGGWQSYTTNTSSAGQPEIGSKLNHPTHLNDHSRTESTESVPTATAPKQWQKSHTSTADAAFAAAAAAGQAMAGAFSGSAFTRDSPQYSESNSDEEETPVRTASQVPDVTETRDFASEDLQDQPLTSTAKAAVPQPTEVHRGVAEAGALTDPAKHTDFPAPLRTSKPNENRQPSPRISIPPIPHSSDDQDPEQLQNDIVQSLTPRTSVIEDTKPEPQPVRIKPRETTRQFSIISDDDDFIPREYSSYWDNRQTATESKEILKESPTRDIAPGESKPLMITPLVGPSEEMPETATRDVAHQSAHPSLHMPVASTEDTTTTKTQSLRHRDSWESWGTRKDEDSKNKDLPNPDFAKGISHERPMTPTRTIEQPPSTMSPPTPIVRKQGETPDDLPHGNKTTILPASTTIAPPHNDTPRSSSAAMPSISTPVAPPLHNTPHGNTSATPAIMPMIRPVFPQEKADFRNILSFKDPSQRIRAFDENRRLYAEPTGLLDQWLTTMNTPEHADVFRSSRTPQASTNVGSVEPRPSPRRDVTSSSGTKQMQEDGKRLLAAAGKYGGKAGTAAKGLFSRGKDKLRTASYGEKVPSHGRRKSSVSDFDTSSIARSQEPVLPESAPQLPTPSLDTPIGEPSWSQLSQMFQDRPSQTSPVSPPSTSLSSVTVTQSGNTSGIATGQYRASNVPAGNERPPASVIASLPGGENVPAKSQQFPNFGVGTEAAKGARALHGSTPLQEDGRMGPQEDRIQQRQRLDSLPLPRPRRASSVSEVSEISTPPEENSDAIPRNISPSLDNQQRGQKVPLVLAPSSTKEAEALQNQNRASLVGGTLPPYSSMKASTEREKPSRIEPGTQIVPVANLKPTESDVDQQTDSRPFSFFGSETLNHAISQQHARNISAGAIPQSPVEDDLPVDIEKSPQPNITEHPAYRNSHDGVPPSVPTNPLPSSRRTPQDVEQTRQKQQIIIPDRAQGDEGYRIPGPYVQEYRSPRSAKPTMNQDFQQNLRRTPEQSPNVPSPAQNRFPSDTGRRPTMDAPSQIEPRPEYERSKSRGFGAMFRTRSRSPNIRQDREGAFSPTPMSDQIPDEGRRRKAFFSLSNRPASPTRQSYDGRETPVQEAGRGRKLSIDMLRPSTFSSRPPLDGKKKRSSGFGALFGMSSGREKDNQKHGRGLSIPSSQSYPQNIGVNNQAPGHVQHPASAIEPRHLPGNQGFDAYDQSGHAPRNGNSQYGASSSAYQETRGYYDPEQQRLDHEKPATDNWQSTAEKGHSYGPASGTPTSSAPWPTSTNQASVDHSQTLTSAPSVPVTRANRDISYGQDRPYIPPISPRPQHGAIKGESRTDMNAHVKNLHTRSRSPRLGRPPSDEHLRTGYNAQGSHPASHRLSLDPASQLGMFSNKKMSPGGAIPRSEEEQEKPWTIGLPGGGEEESDGDHPVGAGGSGGLTSSPYQVFPETTMVSPSTPHQHNQRVNNADVISPVTAVEPRYQGFTATTPAASNLTSREIAAQPPSAHGDDYTGARGDVSHVTNVEQVSVPPSISNAAQIPLPTSHAQQTDTPVVAKNDAPTVQPPIPSSDQTSRSKKQAFIERAPTETQAASLTSSKPLTVAEQLMGVQSAARGTVPEHRSTTPVPHSSVPSVAAQPKSTTWPDNKPNMAAMTTSNNTGTTVTTTTMRSGSKLGRGSIKTSTYVIDSNTPSRQGSTTPSVRSRNGVTQAQTVEPNGSALAPTTANANGNLKIQTPLNTKDKPTTAKTVSHGKSFEAFELPGSRPDGYESEEEIVMSATAYPGQEWMPEYAGIDSDS